MPVHVTEKSRLPLPGKLLLPGLFVFSLLTTIFMVSLPAQSSWAMEKSGHGKTNLQVARITPGGQEVPPGRQLVIQFDRPVVPLGRMERSAAELPISIEPSLNCQWRWLNPASLACNLKEKEGLHPATTYRMAIAPGIVAEDSTTLADTVHHTFTTIRPRITETWFKNWFGPRSPQSAVRLNVPIDRASLAAHLHYSVADRRLAAVVSEDPDYPEPSGGQANSVWLVRPSSELPPGIPVKLQIEPGILTPHGPEAGNERRVLTTVMAIPDFRFLGIRCTGKNNTTFDLRPGPSTASAKRCLPSGGVSLLFSAPVLAEDIQAGLQFTPPLAGSSPDADPWEQVYSYSQLAEPFSRGKSYAVDLPESLLKPYTGYRLQLQAGAVKDQFGRTLDKDVDITFATDHRLPDYALLKNMPVLEKDLDTDAHVWTVNLSELQVDYEAVTANGEKVPGKATIHPVGPKNASIPVPLTVRKLVGQGSGTAQGHLMTKPAVADKSPYDSWFFAQITPFQVHLKLGHHNSMVWITDLRSGQPVADVSLQIQKSTLREFGNPTDPLATAVTDRNGIGLLPGVAVLDPGLLHVYASEPEEQILLLHCRKDDDMAVLPIRYDYQVAAEGANREYIPDWLRTLHGHIRVWGTTAQGIYKAGDTMQYKIFVRDQDNLRFTRPPGAAEDLGSIGGLTKPRVSAPPGADLSPTTEAPEQPRYLLKVLDPQGKVVHERKDISLSGFGTMHGEVTISQNGAAGWYRFVVGSNFQSGEWEAMRVLVSDFTPAPFKVTTDLSGQTFTTGDRITITSGAKLHGGGPYSGAATRVTSTLQPRPFVPDNPLISGFQFDTAEKREGRRPETETLFEDYGNLDDDGRLDLFFTIAETPVWYGQLTVESAVQDDRGKAIANRTSVPCFGRDRFVGMEQNDWTLQENSRAMVRVVVVDRQGKILEGIPVDLKTEYKKTWGARVKGAGDGFHTEYEHRWETEQELKGVSASEPLEFEVTPGHAGNFRLTATITDDAGRSHTTTVERWVTGKGVVLWESTAGNLLGVYPEKTGYKVGDTARFLVQNPFPGGQALITVERFGVLSHWTRILEKSSEIVEIPVLPDYLPGFYVSIMVTSPRVEKPPGPRGEDLGKPTFRMGYVKVPVKDPYKELVVDVGSDRQSYKPRDTVRLDMQVRPRNSPDPKTPLPVELAVAVIDEAVFDLLPEGRKRYDPYQAFYSLDELDLSNYNLLMQLVGREHLALKGASAGGDGGTDLLMRSLFKFVPYWNPSLRPDGDGRASIDFQLPDNLTAWRVLVMAVSPEDRMGLGETLFTVNQSTEIRPALPNQLLAGDRFSAGFTLMNRTDTQRSLAVNFLADGPVHQAGTRAGTGPVRIDTTVTLMPYARHSLKFPLQTTGPGSISLSLTAGDGIDRDGLRHQLTIHQRQEQKVAASYGMTTAPLATENIQFPSDMREDVGELSLHLSPSAIGGVAGAFAFMRDYPYNCWEQKLSRGVMAAMYTPLRSYVQGNTPWPDSDRAVLDALSLAPLHQAPNGGMTYFKAKDQFVSPYLSAFTATAFNILAKLGHQPPELVEQRLHSSLLNLLRHDALPEEYSTGMTATVRAMALAALAEKGSIGLADVQRYRTHLPSMNLFGKSFYLKALIKTGSFIDRQQEVVDSILAHADQSSGQVVFTETKDSGHNTLLSTTPRDNAAILSSLLAWLKAHPADTSISDLAIRLMHSLTLSRKGLDHWANTQENLFITVALAEYAELFEHQPPNMGVSGRLDQEFLGTGRFTAFTDPSLLLRRPIKRGDAGSRALLQVEKEGEGRLYYGTRLTYSPAQLQLGSVNAGIEVFREYSVKRQGRWLLLDNGTPLRTGEVVRVDLYVSLPAERYFVVLEDPVPGGLEPVNRDLATTSHTDAGIEDGEPAEGSHRQSLAGWNEDTPGRWSFYHRELRHDSVRFYSERLAAGRYHLTYTAQAISPGDFQALPLHAEEMYSPEVYGQGVPARLKIEQAE